MFFDYLKRTLQQLDDQNNFFAWDGGCMGNVGVRFYADVLEDAEDPWAQYDVFFNGDLWEEPEELFDIDEDGKVGVYMRVKK